MAGERAHPGRGRLFYQPSETFPARLKPFWPGSIPLELA
jgi:hypothetical protein